MSLCIAMVIPEGIIVAGESRTTQRIAGISRTASDSATKVFELADHLVVASTGWAFLQPQGSVSPKNIAGIIDDFKATLPQGLNVKAVATSLWEYFNAIYQQHIVNQPGDELGPNLVALNFMVAGYDSAASEGELYYIDVPSTTPPSVPVRSTSGNSGPWWMGQTDVVARIVKGYDFRAHEFPFFEAMMQDPANKQKISGLEYFLFTNLMTVQDAIDFAVEMIRITITVQRFVTGTVNDLTSQQGSVAGVGGPIDVVVVRPREQNLWVAKKALHV